MNLFDHLLTRREFVTGAGKTLATAACVFLPIKPLLADNDKPENAY